MAEVTSIDRRMVFLVAGTVEKLQGVGREVPSPDAGVPWSRPPRRPGPGQRRRYWTHEAEPPRLLVPARLGVWSWIIWVTFVKNLWKDGSGLAFNDAGNPTAYFWCT